MGKEIVPSLVAALKDSRFHVAKWEPPQDPPLESTLDLLATRDADETVKFCETQWQSPCERVRKCIALHLASTGKTASIPMLRELMSDADGYVRSYVCMGVGRAVAAGLNPP